MITVEDLAFVTDLFEDEIEDIDEEDNEGDEYSYDSDTSLEYENMEDLESEERNLENSAYAYMA